MIPASVLFFCHNQVQYVYNGIHKIGVRIYILAVKRDGYEESQRQSHEGD